MQFAAAITGPIILSTSTLETDLRDNMPAVSDTPELPRAPFPHRSLSLAALVRRSPPPSPNAMQGQQRTEAPKHSFLLLFPRRLSSWVESSEPSEATWCRCRLTSGTWLPLLGEAAAFPTLRLSSIERPSSGCSPHSICLDQVPQSRQ